MKKIIILLIVLPLVFSQAAKAEQINTKLLGRIVLQVEDKGQAWYIDPVRGQRAYLGRPSDAFRVMREFGLGITEKDFEKFNKNLPDKLWGRILMRVEARGEAYYVSPLDKKLYFLGRPSDAFRVMRELGLGIRNDDLQKVQIMNQYQEAKPEVKNNTETIKQDVGIDPVFTSLVDVYKVEKVVDGDTLDVIIDGAVERLRIIGMDTPEVVDPRQGVDCFGPEASRRAKELLTNSYVRLEKDASQDERDKYGRLLRHVFLVSGKNFATEMINEGFAREYTYKVASKYQNEYKLAEQNAKVAKNGMWAEGACDNFVKPEDRIEKISSSTGLEIYDIFFNGNQGVLEPDEYVEIKNNGASINMENYTLQDKSGKTFRFPIFPLSSNASVKVFTGCGTNTNRELYWCYKSSAIWNNTGDTAELRDAGDKILTSYSY